MVRKERGEDSHGLLTSTAAFDFSPGCVERSKIYANRLQFSRAYAYSYSVVLVLSIFLLVWVVIENDYPLGHAVKFWVFVILDSIVTLFVVLEIAASLLAQGRQNFCMQWSNRADMAVALLCVVALLLHVLGPVEELDLDVEELESVVLVVRYVAMLARLVLIVRKFRRQARKKTLEVHLDMEDEPDTEMDALPPGAPATATASQAGNWQERESREPLTRESSAARGLNELDVAVDGSDVGTACSADEISLSPR
tara:strand:+ start:175 stop:936 length:762 start_codon:yes stop_codon:yes gene_type:complete